MKIHHTYKSGTGYLPRDLVNKLLSFQSGKVITLTATDEQPRSQKFNDFIHPLFRAAAEKMSQAGINFTVGNFTCSLTEAMCKEFFIMYYLAGKRTSNASNKELSEAVRRFLDDLALKGIEIVIQADSELERSLKEMGMI